MRTREDLKNTQKHPKNTAFCTRKNTLNYAEMCQKCNNSKRGLSIRNFSVYNCVHLRVHMCTCKTVKNLCFLTPHNTLEYMTTYLKNTLFWT